MRQVTTAIPGASTENDRQSRLKNFLSIKTPTTPLLIIIIIIRTKQFYQSQSQCHPNSNPSSPCQGAFLVELIRAAEPRTKFHIFLRHLCIVPIELLPCRPDFLVGSLLLGVVLDDSLAAQVLEEQRALLHTRVHLTIEEDAVIDVALCGGAEYLVLRHDAFVHLVHSLEVLLSSVFVAEDLIRHGRFVVPVRNEALNEQEIGTVGFDVSFGTVS